MEGTWWSPYQEGQYGETLVLHVDLSADEGNEQAALAVLDEPELTRLKAYLYPGPRRRFSLCRAALRSILADKLGCRTDQITFAATEQGKPYACLEGRPVPVGFNLSHSGNHGLIAISTTGRPVGIDVEERTPRRNLDELASTVCTPAEHAELASSPDHQKLDRFLRLWTAKEAIIKAFGTGHTLDVSRLQVPKPLRKGEPTATFATPQMPETTWRLDNLENPLFAAALAQPLPPS